MKHHVKELYSYENIHIRCDFYIIRKNTGNSFIDLIKRTGWMLQHVFDDDILYYGMLDNKQMKR